MDDQYSMSKAKELAKKIGDPYDKLISEVSRDQRISHLVKIPSKDEEWRKITTKEEIDRRVNRLEEVVSSDEDIEYYQMLLMFYNAYIAVMKISIVDRYISNANVDIYIDRLEKLYNALNSKWNNQMMRD